jgi:hypothetical protein
VQTVNRPPDGVSPAAVAWQEGDFGMIMRSGLTAGYYVFRVMTTPALNATTLTVRATSAYYSGLLDIPAVAAANFPGYDDQCDDQLGSKGNNGDYLVGSPVLRLDYFNIFLTRPESDGSRTLTLTNDCEDVGDIFLNPPTANRAVPILPNIEDIQIEYITKVTAPAVAADVWAGSNAAAGGVAFPDPCGGGAGTDCPGFYNQFYTKNIASARIFVLLRTEEERNKTKGYGVVYGKPAMGDAAAVTLPLGRYHYTYMQYQVFLRNYSL